MVRELMDCVEDFVVLLDEELRIIRANVEISSLVGLPPTGLEGVPFASLLGKGDRRRVAAFIASSASRRASEAGILLGRGGVAALHFSVSPIGAPGGGAGGFLVVARRKAEPSGAAALDAFGGLEERALVGLPEPVFIIDSPSRTIRECNESAVSVSGFSREELIGARVVDLLTADDDVQKAAALFSRADDAYAKTGVFRERVHFTRKGGRPVPCELVALAVFGRDGELKSKLVMLFDRSMEEERDALLADALQRLKALEADFSASLASLAAPVEPARLTDLGFTRRQLEIARLVVQGESSKRIGAELGVAESTVKNHLGVMFRKLGVTSRIDFVHALTERRIRIA